MRPEEHLVRFWLLCCFCKMFTNVVCWDRKLTKNCGGWKHQWRNWRMSAGWEYSCLKSRQGKKRKFRAKLISEALVCRSKDCFFPSFTEKVHLVSAGGYSKTDPRIRSDKQRRHQSHHQLQHRHSSPLRHKMRPRRQLQPKGQLARATVHTQIFISLLQ